MRLRAIGDEELSDKTVSNHVTLGERALRVYSCLGKDEVGQRERQGQLTRIRTDREGTPGAVVPVTREPSKNR